MKQSKQQKKDYMDILTDSLWNKIKTYQKNMAAKALCMENLENGQRWIVERTFGWFSWYRGIKICWTKTFWLAARTNAFSN
ncbi:hypothetical protein ACFLYA_01505 [Candidatus Dependentiae bacterium]